MDDASFTSFKSNHKPAEARKFDVTVEGKGWNADIKFKWHKPPTSAEVARQIDIKRAERDLKLICLTHSEPSLIGTILAKIRSQYTKEAEQQFEHLMHELKDVAFGCMCAPKEQHHVTTALLKEVIADSTRMFARRRRSEIALRLAIVSFLMCMCWIVFWVAFHNFGFKTLIDPVVHITTGRTALLILFFVRTSISAWASYMRRSMSILEWTTEKDINDLRRLLSDPIRPTIRVLYTSVFALIALAIFHLNVVQITFGEFKTSDVLTDPGVALFLGLMLGLAECTLPSVMSRRAKDLTAALGGSDSAEHATRAAMAKQDVHREAHKGRKERKSR